MRVANLRDWLDNQVDAEHTHRKRLAHLPRKQRHLRRRHRGRCHCLPDTHYYAPRCRFRRPQKTQREGGNNKPASSWPGSGAVRPVTPAARDQQHGTAPAWWCRGGNMSSPVVPVAYVPPTGHLSAESPPQPPQATPAVSTRQALAPLEAPAAAPLQIQRRYMDSWQLKGNSLALIVQQGQLLCLDNHPWGQYK